MRSRLSPPARVSPSTRSRLRPCGVAWNWRSRPLRAGREHHFNREGVSMRGQGRVFRPVVRGEETGIWWLDYGLGGTRHRESSGTTVKRDAQRLLRQRLEARETGRLVGRPDRVVLAEYVKG